MGALLSLRDSGPLAADVMIGSDALRVGVRAALDALAAQVGAAGTDAGAAFATWRDTDMGGLEKPAANASVSVVAVAGRPTLVVDPAAAGRLPDCSPNSGAAMRGPQPAGQRSRNAQTGR